MVPDGALKSTRPYAPTGVDDSIDAVAGRKAMVKALRSIVVFAAAAVTTAPVDAVDGEDGGWVVAGGRAEAEPHAVDARPTAIMLAVGTNRRRRRAR